MITIGLWGIALVVAVVALRRNRQWWLLAALAIASVGTLAGWPGGQRAAAFTVAAADAPGFSHLAATAQDWAVVGRAFTEKGLPDCSRGKRLSRKFSAESGATDAFLDRLEAAAYAYEAFDFSEALRDELGGGDLGGGNTVFRAVNAVTGSSYYGAWVVSWGEGRLFMCEGA